MASYSSRNTPLTCTPHFKADADQPWVTMDSIIAVSLWMSPNSPMTLEDVAQLIENFAATQVQQQLAGQPLSGNVKYQGSVLSMTFRQQTIQRAQMTSLAAKDYIREGENFNLILNQTTTSCCVIV